jgi:hypothetical protein
MNSSFRGGTLSATSNTWRRLAESLRQKLSKMTNQPKGNEPYITFSVPLSKNRLNRNESMNCASSAPGHVFTTRQLGVMLWCLAD